MLLPALLTLVIGKLALSAPIKLVSQDYSTGSIIYDVGSSARYMSPLKTPFFKGSGKGLEASDKVKSTVVALWFNATAASSSTITKEKLVSTIDSYLEKDDVMNKDWLEHSLLVLSSSSSSASLSEDAISHLEQMNVKSVLLSASSFSAVPKSSKSFFKSVSFGKKSGDFLLEGPFISTGDDSGTLGLYPVYRLYVDEFRTFVFGAIADSASEETYSPFLMHSQKFADPLIPVPSRLYTMRDTRPLGGMRLGVKDIYDVAGLQTAAGNRAYTDLYGPANATGPALQRLLNLGAIIVGKTKTAQYASGESFNDNWLEVQYPFNPRGDHWQTCSASSSGSGCAMGAYEWLDLATGSDTGSSMRRPAAVAGVFGNRPSHGIIALDGVVPLVTRQDTLGVFSRDPKVWSAVAHAWYADSPLGLIDYKGVPSKVLYPVDYLPMQAPDAEDVLQTFLGKLNSTFGMETVKFNFSETTLAADNLINNITTASSLIRLDSDDQWTDVGKAVVANYRAENDGRFPPMNPSARSSWMSSAEDNDPLPTAEDVAKADAAQASMADWFTNDFLGANSQSCTDAIMIYDIGTRGLPSYREQTLNTKFGDNGAVLIPVTYNDTVISPATICPYVGCPDFTIQIGQIEYHSVITNHTEHKPVSLSLISAPGCDFMLFNFIAKLQEKGIIKAVKTGRSIY